MDLTDDTTNKFTSWKHKKEDTLRKTVNNLTCFGITLKQNNENNLLSNFLNINNMKSKEIDEKTMK